MIVEKTYDFFSTRMTFFDTIFIWSKANLTNVFGLKKAFGELKFPRKISLFMFPVGEKRFSFLKTLLF